MRSFFGAALAAYATAAESDHWAVVVAASNGYWNYRHQADAAHVVKMLESKGFLSEQIIHMAFDDIAGNPSNPFPGQIFNQPDGENVYDPMNIDYNGFEVNPTNFKAVMTGDSDAVNGRKVLKSDENSKIFVYLVDHGAPGIIIFPGVAMFSDELIDTFHTMNEKKMYSEMTFYLETCESGSMFLDLPSDLNIVAMTASNESLPSYATYCNNDYKNGTRIGACLADEFTINFINDTLTHDTNNRTLEDQYYAV